jgi:D-alanine transfer protein
VNSRDAPPVTPATSARLPHLIAGLSASTSLSLVVALVLLSAQAEIRARRSALSPATVTKEWEGRAAPLAIMQQDDLLPMYGSSELIVPEQNRVTDFFAAYPTGFAVVPIGDRGYPILSMAVGIGSLGSAVSGRRVVISLSGTWLAGDQPQATAINFRGLYSELQTGDLILRSGMPLALRRRFAKRILGYKAAEDIDPLLAAALSCLATQCVAERLLPALVPIWMLESLPRRTRDYVHLAMVLRTAHPAVRHAARLHWGELETRSDSLWRSHSTSNAFGIRDSSWRAAGAKVLSRKGTLDDSTFVRGMEHAPDWDDLDLLLTTLRVLGARPLILTSPLKGAYWDYLGVSASARNLMYRRFDSTTTAFHIPARSFSERDGDIYFLREPRSHLGAKGWLVYDQVIDAFYHNALR